MLSLRSMGQANDVGSSSNARSQQQQQPNRSSLAPVAESPSQEQLPMGAQEPDLAQVHRQSRAGKIFGRQDLACLIESLIVNNIGTD